MDYVHPRLILAGYVWTRLSMAPPGLTSVPTMILTISNCIMEDLPRPEFWDWFVDGDDAEAARARDGSDDMDLVSVAMTATDAEVLFAEESESMPHLDLLRSGVTARGEVLGYEVVGVEHILDLHSWHCHGYADEVSDKLGIHVNDRGLLATHEDATSVLEWMAERDESQAPAPVPWLVVGLLGSGGE